MRSNLASWLLTGMQVKGHESFGRSKRPKFVKGKEAQKFRDVRQKSCKEEFTHTEKATPRLRRPSPFSNWQLLLLRRAAVIRSRNSPFRAPDTKRTPALPHRTVGGQVSWLRPQKSRGPRVFASRATDTESF